MTHSSSERSVIENGYIDIDDLHNLLHDILARHNNDLRARDHQGGDQAWIQDHC